MSKVENSLALREMQALHNMQMNFHVDNQKILVAGERDRAQNNFINAVFNTKKAGEDVSEAITGLAIEAFQLRTGEYAKRKLLLICKEKIKLVMSLLDAVNYSADTVFGPIDHPVDQLKDCHEVARKIRGATLELTSSLNCFGASLDEDPIGDAPERFREVLVKRDELYSLVNSFPALHRNNYCIEAIQRSVMNVAGRNN